MPGKRVQEPSVGQRSVPREPTDTGTFCPNLWEGIYINRSGEVFACCHQKPKPYGNIHDAPLTELVNSPAALQLRADSLRGELSCYATCYLLDKERSVPSGFEGDRIDYRSLLRLHISFGEACNIRCVMCDNPQRHQANPILLNPRVVIRNVDLIPFSVVMLRGGEPLVLRGCLEYMEHLERLGKRYTIMTNGLLIDDARALRLAEHANNVVVSLNGATKEGHESVNSGSCFETVLKNVQRMKRARDSLGSEMALTGHMTITTSNIHEVPLFLRSFREFGFDAANFSYVKETVPLYLATHPEFAKWLKEETVAALREVDADRVDTLRLELLGLWRDVRSDDFAFPTAASHAVQPLHVADRGTAAMNDGDTAPTPVVGDAMLGVLREMDRGSKVVALIRHSERGKALAPMGPSIDEVPLTPRGLELARRFGRELPAFNLTSVSHSSIIRSIQTAVEIEAGFRDSHPESKVILVGADPIFSVIHRGTIDKKVRDAYRASLRGQAFVQMWLDGEVPGTIMRPAKDTIARFLGDVEARLRRAPGGSLHIHVGHDREIELVRTALLGGRFGDYPLMEFLDGLVFCARGRDATRVRWRDCVVELAPGSDRGAAGAPGTARLGGVA